MQSLVHLPNPPGQSANPLPCARNFFFFPLLLPLFLFLHRSPAYKPFWLSFFYKPKLFGQGSQVLRGPVRHTDAQSRGDVEGRVGARCLLSQGADRRDCGLFLFLFLSSVLDLTMFKRNWLSECVCELFNPKLF